MARPVLRIVARVARLCSARGQLRARLGVHQLLRRQREKYHIKVQKNVQNQLQRNIKQGLQRRKMTVKEKIGKDLRRG